jgi:hypothetical protein
VVDAVCFCCSRNRIRRESESANGQAVALGKKASILAGLTEATDLGYLLPLLAILAQGFPLKSEVSTATGRVILLFGHGSAMLSTVASFPSTDAAPGRHFSVASDLRT